MEAGRSLGVLFFVLLNPLIPCVPLVTAIVFDAFPVFAATIVIPTDYPTIQEGIDAASPGDSIQVAAGTYNENILVDKEWLVIDGIGLHPKTIYPAVSDLGSAEEPVFGHSQVIVVAASNVTIQDLTIDVGNFIDIDRGRSLCDVFFCIVKYFVYYDTLNVRTGF